jgi:hypothetical protein
VRQVICDLLTSPYVDLAGARMLGFLGQELAKDGVGLRITDARSTMAGHSPAMLSRSPDGIHRTLTRNRPADGRFRPTSKRDRIASGCGGVARRGERARTQAAGAAAGSRRKRASAWSSPHASGRRSSMRRCGKPELIFSSGSRTLAHGSTPQSTAVEITA